MENRNPGCTRSVLASLAVTFFLLAGCTTPTPYAPATDRFGYRENAIESDRFRVSFRGNSATDRETVETYLLYRAAELTLEKGGTFFTVVARDLEKNKRYVHHTYYPFAYSGYGAYGYHGGYYFRSSFAHGTSDSIAITRYEAIAEIVIGGEELRTDGPSAYDAREVLENIGPRVERPRN
ncbi:hypothetical protein NUH88_21985 [Nisaea acidiphila]|uniref:Lipoprotein n=1 Tax=Nisaea acidiphila TaxID=1862145 RepID=A0A9J7AX62_9PROT|nr:hypothetical protein [Nisaea acidiphila]UUX50045.1 hypothetical protein NUH88_21985 [Nisaea acidiphila]